MTMPGFTAEASLYWVSEGYLNQDVGIISSLGNIVPAHTCCAPCGKDLCCDECHDSPPDGGDGTGSRFKVFRFRMSM